MTAKLGYAAVFWLVAAVYVLVMVLICFIREPLKRKNRRREVTWEEANIVAVLLILFRRLCVPSQRVRVCALCALCACVVCGVCFVVCALWCVLCVLMCFVVCGVVCACVFCISSPLLLIRCAIFFLGRLVVCMAGTEPCLALHSSSL